MKVFVISGSPRSGKDTFVKFVQTYHPETINYSSVDYIRWLATKYLNFNDKVKDNKGRKFLSEFKKILTDYNDFPFELCKSVVYEHPEHVIFLHVREISEIDKLKNEFPLKVIYVTNNNYKMYNNDSDDNQIDVMNISDVIIHNDSSLEELNKTAKWFVETFILE